MLLATPVSLVPDSTNTVISTEWSFASSETRNRSSPLEPALPLEVMFQASAMGGELAACTAPAPTSVAQTTADARRITQNLLERNSMVSPARPGGFPGARM